MRRALLLSLVAALPLVGAGAVVAPASAASTSPVAGQCFDMTVNQASADDWPGMPALPCSTPHAVEVTAAGPLPADVNAVAFSRTQCSAARVWASVGVNAAISGVIADPIRVESFAFVVRSPRTPATYACAAGALRWNGRADESFVRLAVRIADLSAAQRAALRFCLSAAGGRSPFAPWISVPCSRTARWQVTRWIVMADLYASYPGEAAMKVRVAAMCAPATRFRYPTARDWTSGETRAWCFQKYP